MQKYIWTMIVLLTGFCFSNAALAATRVKLSPTDAATRITRQMINSREIPLECVVQENGDPLKMVSIERINIAGPEGEAYLVEGGVDACCQGARRCAQWVYERSESGPFVKLLGPVFGDDLKPAKKITNGKRDLILSLPGGYSYPASKEHYRFDGYQYQEAR